MQVLKNIYQWIFGGDIKKVDWRAYLICMVLAGVIWALNALGNEHKTELSYKVVFRDETTHNLNLPNTNPTISFVVKGKGWNILQEHYKNRKGILNHIIKRKLRDNHLLATDLRQSLNSSIVKGLNILEIRQDTFPVNIDQTITKQVPITIYADQISLKNNYFIDGEIHIIPDTVNLTGSLKDIHHVDTLLLSISKKEINKDFEQKLDVQKLVFKDVISDPKEIRVAFKVSKFITKIIEVPIQKVSFSNQNKLISPQNKAEIVYTCRAKDLKKINAGDFQVVADFNHMNPKDSTLDLSLEHVPSHIISANINEQHIKLKVK